MKKIKALRQQKLHALDALYEGISADLQTGFAAEPFNKKGQRTQSTFLSQFKVLVEEIQELNRTLKLISQK